MALEPCVLCVACVLASWQLWNTRRGCGILESDMSYPATVLSNATPDDPLAADRRERFCQLMAQGEAQWRSYCTAFDRSDLTAVQANARAWQLIHRYPEVRARIDALRRAAAERCVVTIAELVQQWHDIATADVNEIVSVLTDSCRHCRGDGHRYQWIDLAEYAAAVVAHGDKPNVPDDLGGYGFDPRLDPLPDCPRCFGRGVANVVVRDTDKLSPAARRLYRGAKRTKYGVEILLEDAAKARDSIGRVLGCFKDGYVLVSPAAADEADEAAEAVKPDMDVATATKAYLKLCGGTG